MSTSWRAHALNTFLRLHVKPRLEQASQVDGYLADARKRMDGYGNGARQRFPQIRISAIDVAGVPCERLVAPQAGHATCIYLHGGAFAMGSPRSHRLLTLRLADISRARLIVPDYRLAPEHPWPAGVDDIVAVYEELAARRSPQRVVIAGDSAGGNLVLATLMRLREAGLPMPAGAVCLSPWTDLTGSGASVADNAQRDPFLPASQLDHAARLYAGENDRRQPAISPLYGDFTGLPPLLIHVGEQEILLDDSVRVAERARQAGVAVKLRIWPDMPHVFQLFTPLLPEADAALSDIAEFIETVTPASTFR